MCNREAQGAVRLLHTADWHIGRRLCSKKRYGEHEAFLEWLAETMGGNGVDVLVVAGDVFDTSTPSSRAQELYYRFLRRAAASPCRHVVIVGGNHDSPSFLNAPRGLLKMMDVHVVGSCTKNAEGMRVPADDVIVLKNEQGLPEMVVCAVPYLRDRDIRSSEAGEGVEDKERKLVEGIRNHYAGAAAAAEAAEVAAEAAGARFAEFGGDSAGIPVVATGHLFTAGGRTVEGDGVRELYVGSLARAPVSIFPDSLDYTALGHLHVPQTVGGRENVRYSGSPLPMGFGEAHQQKSVCLVEFRGKTPSVDLIEVPVFQRLEQIGGDWRAISNRIFELSAVGSDAWLEVSYEGDELVSDLRGRIEECLEGTRMEVLRVRNNRVMRRVLNRIDDEETLDDLDENDVFERCLAAHRVSEDERGELRRTYAEAVESLRDEGGDAGT